MIQYSCSYAYLNYDGLFIGGLGSAVAEVLSSVKENKSKLIKLGVKDTYPPGGEYSYLIKLLNLDSGSLYKQFKKILNI